MARLRDGETRDDSHNQRNLAQLREAGAGDPCPDCGEGELEDHGCPTCPTCGWSKCGGGKA